MVLKWSSKRVLVLKRKKKHRLETSFQTVFQVVGKRGLEPPAFTMST